MVRCEGPADLSCYHRSTRHLPLIYLLPGNYLHHTSIHKVHKTENSIDQGLFVPSLEGCRYGGDILLLLVVLLGPRSSSCRWLIFPLPSLAFHHPHHIHEDDRFWEAKTEMRYGWHRLPWLLKVTPPRCSPPHQERRRCDSSVWRSACRRKPSLLWFLLASGASTESHWSFLF